MDSKSFFSIHFYGARTALCAFAVHFLILYPAPAARGGQKAGDA